MERKELAVGEVVVEAVVVTVAVLLNLRVSVHIPMQMASSVKKIQI